MLIQNISRSLELNEPLSRTLFISTVKARVKARRRSVARQFKAMSEELSIPVVNWKRVKGNYFK